MANNAEICTGYFGIINVNKPKGFTSHDVIAKLRKIFNIKQIGHTGTLDPLATGVLPVCIGKATKLIQYLEDSKAYRAYIELGTSTDTFDTYGEITEINPVKLDVRELEEALKTFQGEITQRPPIYSAVHYKGKRLYEYARANIAVEDIPERKVKINLINLVEVIDLETEHPVAVIDISCSAGTYIRSIVNDLGNKLGCGAVLKDLVRTRSGNFKIEDSYTIDEIKEFVENDRLSEILINPICVLDLKCYTINQDEVEKIRKGQYIKISDSKKEDFQEEIDKKEKIQLVFDNKLVSISRIEEDKIFPVNVFV